MTDDSKDIIEQELNKAINFLGQNKFLDAEGICNKIIKEKDNADAYHILSSIKLYQQEFHESINLVNKSIEINNENPGYYVTLGCAFSASKDYVNSIAAFKKSINLNDKTAQVHFYLGESYRKLKKYNDSIASFYRSIELSPDHVAAYMLLGLVYQEKKQFDLSVKSFKKCIEIMPDYAEAHLNLGLCYLLIGDYENGWREYEWRKKLIKTSSGNLNKEWTGQSLDNKTLLILEEGDENLIQFSRLARELHKDNCKIILQCSKEASELMANQKWINEVVAADIFPEHDYHAHIGSLMKVLQYNPNNISHEFPYIESSKIKQECIEKEKLNIGVALETNMNSNSHDDESIDIEIISNIFNESHNIICLDEYITKENFPNFYNKFFDYANLNELSSLISNLDLVVTVDNIVAHVAGALNINTILMLPCVPNWRWEITHRHTSPWYKSVTIYRQETPGDWISVVKKVKEKIQGNKYV
jgi:tetratricopeptide (TPR) repeat protein